MSILAFSCKDENECAGADYNSIPIQNKLLMSWPPQESVINCYISNSINKFEYPEQLSESKSWATFVQLRSDTVSCLFIDSVYFNGEKMLAENAMTCYYSLGEAPPNSSFQDTTTRVWQLYDSSTDFQATLEVTNLMPHAALQINDDIWGDGDYSVSIGATNADQILVSLGPFSKYLPPNSTSCYFSSDEIRSLECGLCPIEITAYTQQDTVVNGKTVSILCGYRIYEVIKVLPLLEE